MLTNADVFALRSVQMVWSSIKKYVNVLSNQTMYKEETIQEEEEEEVLQEEEENDFHSSHSCLIIFSLFFATLPPEKYCFGKNNLFMNK